MLNSHVRRRSQRFIEKYTQSKQSEKTSRASSSRVQKKQGQRRSLRNKEIYIHSWLHASTRPELAQSILPELVSGSDPNIQRRRRPSCVRKTRTTPIVHQFIEDEVESDDEDTEEECDEENEESENSESGELVELSGDNIESRAADDLRRNSYDSRFEPGNEEYELDEFIVGDDDESDIESIGSEITIHRNLGRSPSLQPRTSVITITSRRSSRRSMRSSISILQTQGMRNKKIAELPKSDNADEIVDEIMDALALFSRRCNRNREPLMLVLAAATCENAAVREALQDAVRCRLGKALPTADETEVWVIGPER